MEVVEYIQFQPRFDCPPIYTYDQDDCESDQVLCIHKDKTHYHVEVHPFTIRGSGFVHGDHMSGALVPTLYENFLSEITSLINGQDDFVLAFNVTGNPDWETGHIDDWDYDLLGTLEQDGSNLIVKPIESTSNESTSAA
jgi:hypothetical protein